MARRTLDETRELLLGVGIEMLYERGAGVSVGHIKLSDVVTAAGLTTGAAYRCWDNQEAFHRDLAVAALGWRDRSPVSETADVLSDLVERGASFPEVVRMACEANLFRYPDHTAFLTTIALRACGPTDEGLARASRERLGTAVDSFGAMYRAVFALYGRRMRPPFTLAHFTLALAAVSEGFALQAMSGAPHPYLTRDDLGVDDCPEWSLFAFTVEAILDRMTECSGEAPAYP